MGDECRLIDGKQRHPSCTKFGQQLLNLQSVLFRSERKKRLSVGQAREGLDEEDVGEVRNRVMEVSSFGAFAAGGRTGHEREQRRAESS